MEDSELWVRGNAASIIGGGDSPSDDEEDGLSILAASSVVVVSGASLTDPIDAGLGVVLMPNPAEPFLAVVGDDSTGLRRILVFGPAGKPALVALSLAPALLLLPGLAEGGLWLDPLQILSVAPLVLQGQDHPASLLVVIPDMPGLVGLAAWTQALCPDLPGTLDPTVPLLTNAGQMVLH